MKDKNKVFIKEHSREYSLLKLFGWSYAVNVGLKKIANLDLRESCAIYSGGDLIDVYYEEKKLKKFHLSLENLCNENPHLIKRQINSFYKIFEKLEKYYSGKKIIENIKELEKIHELYREYWVYLGIVFTVPNLSVDKILIDHILEARKKTQEHNESIEPIFKTALSMFYSFLKNRTRFIMPDDIWKNKLDKKKLVKEVKKRERGFVLYKNKLYTGKQSDVLKKLKIKLNDRNKNKNIQKIKGNIAQKGKAKGITKIISSAKELGKIKKNDILVVAMTMPRYLPAMKRATAIITDEGGITCHAAIVSRELQKPCIVGTKIATQVLRDGDLVEVDADKGIVKIIKRKNGKR